ncbi:hypothetical protein [Streptomyces sp. NBC_01353]|uniref:hypothetical protein n=1 Tax=Streptomyces sp. NBC_01353 TaxID=2903835 RepID=UPI002E370F7F|nr:hypothetical protein [Streptomyces sp. NBC_01353]
MTDTSRSTAYLCGHLWAALHALRVISGRPDPAKMAGGRPLLDAQRFPHRELTQQLARAGERLCAAQRRGAGHAGAAAEIFRSIPDHLPADGKWPNGLEKADQEEFLRGFRTGLGQYETAHGAVMS